MKELTGRHFIFQYADHDIEAVKEIMDTAESMYDRVIKEFNIQPDDGHFDFVICPDVESFIQAAEKTEETYQPWMVGNANYEKRVLCILTPAAADRTLEDMLAVVRHEVVHIVFGNVSEKSPEEISPLISEGIAVYLAEQIYPNLLDKNSRPDALKLNDEDYFYENDGYNYSGVYMGFLIRKYGREVFKKIYSEKEKLETYLYDGFEEDAIDEFHG